MNNIEQLKREARQSARKLLLAGIALGVLRGCLGKIAGIRNRQLAIYVVGQVNAVYGDRVYQTNC